MDRSVKARKLLFHAGLAAFGFLLAVGVVWLMVKRPGRLVALGVIGSRYSPGLLAFGLGGALCFVGLLRTGALLLGKSSRIWVDCLGGGMVLVLLVAAGGAVGPKPAPAAFAITVRLHGPAGREDRILRNQGRVWMYLPTGRRSEFVDASGEARFRNVPGEVHGQEIGFRVVADGFELVEPDKSVRLTGDEVYLPVRPASDASPKVP